MTTEERKGVFIGGALGAVKSLWPELCVVAACLVLLMSVVGLPSLSTRGEAREALVAFDMFTNHHYILPDGYGGEVPSKPPMLHWLISLVAYFSGMNEFAARAPSGIFAALFMGLYFGILRRLRSDGFAWVATGMLFFSFEWLRAATTCRVDLLHSSCLAAGWLCYFMTREGSGATKWWTRVGCVAVAGAFLSKGPVAVLLVILVISPWEFFRWQRVKTPWSEIVGIVIWFIVLPSLISSLWYLAAYLQGGDAFTDKFIEENLSRFSGTMKKPAHEHHWVYLIGTGLLGTLPWSILVVLAAWKMRLNLKFPPESFFRFSLLAAVVVFLFYSLPSSKRGVYLLVSYPFWVVVALDLGQQMRDSLVECVSVLYRYLCIFIIGIYSAIGVFYVIGRIAGAPFTSGNWERYPLYVTYLVHELAVGRLGGIAIVLVLLPLTVAVCSVAGLMDRAQRMVPEYLRGQRWTGIKVCALFSALYLGLQGSVLPVIGSQTSGKAFAQTLLHVVESAPVISFRQEFYSLSYYSGVRMRTREQPFFFDEWVVLAKNDVAELQGLLGEGQTFVVRASEPPGLKNGKETVLGQVVKKTAVKGSTPEEKQGGSIRRY
jgi:4-amino-4-deoxy-L-arabinose transferase-like glycosyltransferase